MSLTLDFGLIGYHDDKEPFRVRLDAEALHALIADARRDWRVYELTLIQRPGDVWDYVHVTPEAVPVALDRRIAEARAAAKIRFVAEHPWPEGKVPFAAFDDLFQPVWAYDPEPLDEAWRGRSLDGYARELFAVAQAAKASMDDDDPLIVSELSLISARAHALDDLSRREALKQLQDGFHAPRADRHGGGFYGELARLLPDPELVSVACRGEGDWTMLRLLCAEQRLRADATGHRPLHSLFISMSADVHPAVGWWGGEVMWFSEGLAHGDLLIEDRPNGAPIKELIERYRRRPQVVLADAADVQIDGYQRTDGNGWVRFDRIEPTSRRLRVEIIGPRRSFRELPVVRFSEAGGSVFAFEFGIVVLGEALDAAAITCVAEVVGEWRKHGAPPLALSTDASVVPAGQDIPGVHLVPAALSTASEDEQRDWLQTLLRERMRWIDVALVLNAPHWLAARLGEVLDAQRSPWAPWVVATEGTQHLSIDHALGTDPTSDLQAALASARAAKPVKWLRL